VRIDPKLLTDALRSIARLARDRRGVSAIEFAMIAPALILIYVGVVETSAALTVYRRTSEVAATAADLTAQAKSVTKSDVQDIEAASSSILTPYSTTPLKIVLSSVVADANNRGKVDWSCSNSGSARATGSSYTVPAGLTEPNSSVIVAEVTYKYSSLLGLTQIFDPGTFTMTRTFYSRPRRSATVEKTDNGC
jgi:Flp pilus assembly protein TadG